MTNRGPMDSIVHRLAILVTCTSLSLLIFSLLFYPNNRNQLADLSLQKTEMLTISIK
jgi:hypothetical protein